MGPACREQRDLLWPAAFLGCAGRAGPLCLSFLCFWGRARGSVWKIKMRREHRQVLTTRVLVVGTHAALCPGAAPPCMRHADVAVAGRAQGGAELQASASAARRSLGGAASEGMWGNAWDTVAAGWNVAPAQVACVTRVKAAVRVGTCAVCLAKSIAAVGTR